MPTGSKVWAEFTYFTVENIRVRISLVISLGKNCSDVWKTKNILADADRDVSLVLLIHSLLSLNIYVFNIHLEYNLGYLFRIVATRVIN